MFWVKGVAAPCFKQLPPKLNLNLDFFHSSFGEAVNVSFDNPLDSHSEIMNGRPGHVVLVLLLGWNSK